MLSFVSFVKRRLFEALETPVLRNPPMTKIKQIAREDPSNVARFVIDEFGDIYVAKAHDIIHSQMMVAQGVSDDDALLGFVTYEHGQFYYYISQGEPRRHKEDLARLARFDIHPGDSHDWRTMMQLGAIGARW
jgi:hypothetical protein